MKNLIRTISFLIIIFSLFCLSGCNYKGTIVTTELNVNTESSGSRTIYLSFPPYLFARDSIESMHLADVILQNCPKELSFEKIADANETIYKFTLPFNSIEDYSSKVEKIIKRTPCINFCNKTTCLSSGVCFEEDFTSKELFPWLIESCKNNEWLKKSKIELKCAGTKFIYNDKSYWTNSNIFVNNTTFHPVEKIKIYTKDNFNNTFNRTITFILPDETTTALREDISAYFENRNIHINPNNPNEYTIDIFGTDLNELSEKTQSALDNIAASKPSYQLDVNQSNLLTKTNIFKDVLNFSAFSSDNKGVKVEYIYDGATDIAKQYIKGKLESVGEINSSNIFTFNTSTNGFVIYIPFKTNFLLAGMDIKLDYINNKDILQKSIYLKYDKNNTDALNHASWFAQAKDPSCQCEIFEDSKDLTCKISKSGDIKCLSEFSQNMLGTNNAMEIEPIFYNFDTHDSLKIKDHLQLKSLLINENNSIPINYVINTNKKCSVDSLKYTIGQRKVKTTATPDSNGDIKIKLSRQNTDIICITKSINKLKVAFALALITTIVTCILLLTFYLSFRKKKNS